jgi:rSAM/selenodomain-associated transferase 2
VIVSIVIPTYNEARTIAATLAALESLPGRWETVVVDGGSEDATVRIARGCGARVAEGPRGRGEQMNAGAALATGEVLLFLHADTRLPADAYARIREACTRPEVAGGCFRLLFDENRPAFRILGFLTRFPCRFFHHGDQAFFVRAGVFRRLGGYRPYPIMEDVDFWLRLRKAGRAVVLPARVVTSARRFQRYGVARQLMLNVGLVSLFVLGVSPYRLKRMYEEIR